MTVVLWKIMRISRVPLPICKLFTLSMKYVQTKRIFVFLLQVSERLQEVEEETMIKTVELEKQLSDANTEIDELKVRV